MKNDNKNIRVAFYLRVSTDEQARDGYGLDMQLNGLQEMMEYRHKHHDWVHQAEWEYVDDGYSGGNLERPEYKRMMKDAQAKKFDIIAVWKIDRLSRNLSHLLASFESLQKNDVNFFSLKENIDFSGPIGKLTFQIFGALAEFERETIAMRTKEGKKASARSGNYVINSAPFGYEKIQREERSGKTLKIIEGEAQWVREIFKLFNAGASLESIAKKLNEHQVMKGAGGMNENRVTKWYGTTIKDILQNTTYCGNAIYKTKVEKGEVEKIGIPVPLIVSPLDFSIAEARIAELANNSQRGGNGKTQNDYLLSRKIVDVETGGRFYGATRSKGGHSYRRDKIPQKGIPTREIVGKTVDDYVWGFIEKAINRPKDLFDAYKKQNIENTNYNALIDQRRKISLDLQKLDDTEITIEKDYYGGKMDEVKKNKLVSSLISERKALEQKVGELDRKLDSIVELERTKQALEAFSQNLTTKIDNLSMEQKKTLVNILVEKIEVTYTKNRDGEYSAPNIYVVMRFTDKLMQENQSNPEPKKLSANSKTDSEELNNDGYGGKELNGYFIFGVYCKVRKRQYGNRWNTQFVNLFREEVRKLEERYNSSAVTMIDFPLPDSIQMDEICNSFIKGGTGLHTEEIYQ